MTGDLVFVDTNILIYAHDLDAGDKNQTARKLLQQLWDIPGSAAVSVQVLQEFYVNLTRKGITRSEAGRIVQTYAAWYIVQNTTDLLKAAISFHEHQQTSFWDALIIAPALKSGATVLFSEDLSHGQTFGTVTIKNPFA